MYRISIVESYVDEQDKFSELLDHELSLKKTWEEKPAVTQ